MPMKLWNEIFYWEWVFSSKFYFISHNITTWKQHYKSLTEAISNTETHLGTQI